MTLNKHNKVVAEYMEWIWVKSGNGISAGYNMLINKSSNCWAIGNPSDSFTFLIPVFEKLKLEIMFDYLYDDLIKHQWTCRVYANGGEEVIVEEFGCNPSVVAVIALSRVISEIK